MSDLTRDDQMFVDHIERIAAQLTDEDHQLVAPPPSVWEGIEAQLAATDVEASGGKGGKVIHGRFRRPSLPVMAVAAAVVAIAAVAAVLVTNRDDGRVLSEVAIVNDGLPVANPDEGRAELIEVDGRLVLDVEVPELPAADGFYELWVIDTSVEGMHSLGIVTGDGRFPLPDGLDPADFPVVDISVEPTDGDPTHSGQSIWRGVLEV